MTPSQLQDSLRRGHGVNVGNVMVSNSLADAKKEERQTNDSFGLIASFLNALAGTNNGTTTSLCYQDGTFQRAFLALGMCVKAFPTRPASLALTPVISKRPTVESFLSPQSLTATVR